MCLLKRAHMSLLELQKPQYKIYTTQISISFEYSGMQNVAIFFPINIQSDHIFLYALITH